MKKWISALFAIVLAMALCMPAFAAPGAEAGSVTIENMPDSVEIPVLLSANVSSGYYTGTVEDGSVTVTGPDFTAEADNAPEGAVRLVVVPISDDEPLEWFNGCVGELWSSTGTIYAVYYEDADGNRLDAPNVRMTVQIPGGYNNLNVNSVDPDESVSALDYKAYGTSVNYTTDGKLYSGVVHRQGLVDEETVVGDGAPNITLDMTPDELADAVLSDEELEYLDNGADVHIRLTVEDITDTVSASDKQAVESVAGDYTVGAYIDIELLKQIGDRPWENVHETKSPIRITIDIPERLLGVDGREFAIACVHNGKGYLLKDLDNDPTTITIETSQFSTYAILYRDPGTPDQPDDPGPTKPDTPPTGDSSRLELWAAVAVLSATGLGVVLVYGRKKKREER